MDNLKDNPVYPFRLHELERLIAYRAAVRAGFYTDWPPTQARRPAVRLRATVCLDAHSAERR
jgi:hypothetical protein